MNDWVTITSATNGSGNGRVFYSISANTNAFTRDGKIQIGNQYFTISQSGGAPHCSYSLSPGSRAHGAGADTGAVAVTTPSDCSWSAFTSNAWVTILSGANGVGSGQVIYSVSSNTAPVARNGTIRIADQNFFISQSATTNGNFVSLSEALDTTGTPFVWITGGTLYWSGQRTVSHDGVDAAQTWVPSTSGSGSGSLQTYEFGAGTLSFWWKVSSETNNDTLRFYLNGAEQTRISG